jgi:hypothetical protein
MRENDQLDLLIDAALATYSEPRAGLEDRVLQALAAERQPGAAMPQSISLRRRWLPWAIALPVAACALLALLIQLREPHREAQARIPSSPLPSHDSSRLTAIAAAKTPAPISHRARPSASRTAPELQVATLPKLDVFPTPQPMTPQEKALFESTTRASKSQLMALVTAQHHPEGPLTIAAIKIPPIEPIDEGNN